MAVCTVLTQSAYADVPSVASDRYTNIDSNADTRHDITQNTAPLISRSMSSVRLAYSEICIFCHIPNMANHMITAPLWNRTIKVLPITRPTKNSELPP